MNANDTAPETPDHAAQARANLLALSRRYSAAALELWELFDARKFPPEDAGAACKEAAAATKIAAAAFTAAHVAPTAHRPELWVLVDSSDPDACYYYGGWWGPRSAGHPHHARERGASGTWRVRRRGHRLPPLASGARRPWREGAAVTRPGAPTPRSLAIAAADALQALADTRLAAPLAPLSHERVLRADRRNAAEALDRWADAVGADGWQERACSINEHAVKPEILSAWAEALREWAREQGEVPPPREELIDAAVTEQCENPGGWDWRSGSITISKRGRGAVETIIAEEREIRASLARVGATSHDGCWTLPRPASRVAEPDPGATPSAPQKPAEGATPGQRVARDVSVACGVGFDFDVSADLARRIDALLLETMRERDSARADVARLTREHEAERATLTVEIDAAKTRLDEVTRERDEARAEALTALEERSRFANEVLGMIDRLRATVRK